MKIYTKQDNFTLYEGNMLDMLSEIEENSIDSIVTDPPYELNFMGKTWDKSGIAFQKETWEKCLSVLKPGGYLVAFGGSRTFHRIACAIEDAGFEIREIISWIYGSGMPKSMNIGLAIDKRNGVDGEIIGYRNHQDFNAVGQYQNQISGINKRSFGQMSNVERIDTPIYKSTNEFDDWWTGLKPAYEPIIIARKPCEGSVIDNVLKYRVGGMNIGECRIEHNEETKYTNRQGRSEDCVFNSNTCGINNEQNHLASADERGRFPSNVILSYDDESEEEVCKGFPITKSTGGSGETSIKSGLSGDRVYNGGWNHEVIGSHLGGLGDEGSAARYFYCAKASVKDREEGLDDFVAKKVENEDSTAVFRKNIHPTVKPTELMQYLVRLVTPKKGTVLDPFNGSGSTGKACMWENKERNAEYQYIGIELTSEYLPIAKARIEYVSKVTVNTKEQLAEQVKNSAKVENRLLNMINKNKS